MLSIQCRIYQTNHTIKINNASIYYPPLSQASTVRFATNEKKAGLSFIYSQELGQILDIENLKLLYLVFLFKVVVLEISESGFCFTSKCYITFNVQVNSGVTNCQ